MSRRGPGPCADGFEPAAAVLLRWERRVSGSDVAVERRAVHVDEYGRAVLDEAFLARLFHDAGWERTA